MEAQATLIVVESTWQLQLADGRTAAVEGKVRKKARQEHGLTDSDGGAVVRARFQKRQMHGGPRLFTVAILKIVTPSLRLEAVAKEEADAQKRAEQLAAASRQRAQTEAHRQQVHAQRSGAGMSVEDLRRVYRQQLVPKPQVNTYTFLPYATNPPQDRFQQPLHHTQPDTLVDGSIADGPLYSGMLELELQVKTPLCIFGRERTEPAEHRYTKGMMQAIPAPQVGDHALHKHVDYLRDSQDQPTIPGSSLKGVTRSWFEAITSSERRSDEAPVAWRSTAVGKHRRLGLLSLTNDHGTAPPLSGRGTGPDGLPRKPPKGLKASIRPVATWDAGVGELPDDKRVLARFDATVERFGLKGQLTDGQTVKGPKGIEGKLKVGISMQGEVSVHVGLIHSPDGPPIELDDTALRCWFAAHTDGGPPRPPKTDQRFTKHGHSARAADPATLKHGDLVWYQIDESGKVAYFGKLRNGRWAALTPLAGKVPRGQEPPHDRQRRSPAHRVFGYSDESDLFAGRVRFGPASFTGGTAQTKTYTLRALAAPKLSSAGLYLDGEGKELSWTAPDDGTVWLAGTKAYWHTVPAEVDGIANDARVAEEQRVKGTPARTTQNRTVTAITQGAFRTQIHFEDLSPRELGALLLATTLRFDDTGRQVGWKLGMGRPVGMGSLENKLISLRLRDDSWKRDPLTAGWSDGSTVVDELLREAREYYLPNEQDRSTLAAIADHHTLVHRTVGYPGLKTLFRRADGESPRQPTAKEVIAGSSMDLK